jgi:hypothetical protein
MKYVGLLNFHFKEMGHGGKLSVDVKKKVNVMTFI